MEKLFRVLIPASLLLVSVNSVAAERSVTKEINVGQALVLSAAGGIESNLFIVSYQNLQDIPSNEREGVITSINYVSAGYEVAGEVTEMCYYRPYTSRPLDCIEIGTNTTGVVHDFDGQEFAMGMKVSIVHYIPANGSLYYANPTRDESVTYNYLP